MIAFLSHVLTCHDWRNLLKLVLRAAKGLRPRQQCFLLTHPTHPGLFRHSEYLDRPLTLMLSEGQAPWTTPPSWRRSTNSRSREDDCADRPGLRGGAPEHRLREGLETRQAARLVQEGPPGGQYKWSVEMAEEASGHQGTSQCTAKFGQTRQWKLGRVLPGQRKGSQRWFNQLSGDMTEDLESMEEVPRDVTNSSRTVRLHYREGGHSVLPGPLRAGGVGRSTGRCWGSSSTCLESAPTARLPSSTCLAKPQRPRSEH